MPLLPNERSGRLALQQGWGILSKYASFIGPGIMVSVAYMDPGNYSTAVSSGADYEYSLLIIIFLSNLFAVVLQCLCVKLGTVTGLDLAEMCRLNLPWWLNLFLYACAEIAIIATDLAEVVGTAIALEILFGIPLVYGVLITVLDVLIILFAYHKDGNLRQTRTFEIMVAMLVAATCVCFVVELFKCDFEPGSFGKIVEGFLPMNLDVFTESRALFLSCGIVGSTVMPHSLYLGSSLVQSRLKDYDIKNGNVEVNDEGEINLPADEQNNHFAQTQNKFLAMSDGSSLARKYRPSHAAIKYCLNYSYTELVLSLFIIAVFVNASILIVAGSTLYGKPDADDADLLSIYEMLSHYISPAAGLIFALSMLFSGQSAGIVCTMAGQIISEGFINWSFKPWLRRIITRVLAIIPVLIVIIILGREGVATIMNSSQVVLSFILPVVSAPLIWFTASRKYMAVSDIGCGQADEQTALLSEGEGASDSPQKVVFFENSKWLNVAAIGTWLIITFLNIYLVYLFSIGIEV